MDGREPRALSGCYRSALPALAGGTLARGARTRFALRHLRTYGRECFADQSRYPFREGQDALQNAHVLEIFRSRAGEAGNRPALCWPLSGCGHGGVSHLFGRKTQRVHTRTDCRAARKRGFPLVRKAEKAPRPPLRKLLVQDGEGGMDQALRLAHSAGGLEKDIGVDRSTQIRALCGHARLFSARSRQGFSRSSSAAALHFVAGDLNIPSPNTFFSCICDNMKRNRRGSGLLGHFEAIDAARTLAYDAARHSFVFYEGLKGNSAAYEVSNSLLECRLVISSWDECELRPAAAVTVSAGES